MEEKNNLNIENEAADKKAKKKWSKKKKAGVSCLVIVLLAAITAFSFIIVAPAAYLANKYDEPIYSYKLKRVIFPRLYLNEPIIVFPELYFTNPRWEFEKNGTVFNVEYAKDALRKQATYKFCFFDDLQLEELEQWSTEYLQENVCVGIVGIKIRTWDIFKAYGNELITEGSVSSFIAEKERLVLYVQKDDIVFASQESSREQIIDGIKQHISDNLNISNEKIKMVLVNDKKSITRHNIILNDETGYWPSIDSLIGCV